MSTATARRPAATDVTHMTSIATRPPPSAMAAVERPYDVWLLFSMMALVGIGTRMANGCTSGHGVCGMSRFSLRGIVASAVYVVFGMIAMAVLRHGLGVI